MLEQLWRRLTEPPSGITDPVERRTARLLSSLLLVVVPVGGISAGIQILRDHAFGFDLVLGVLIVLLLVTYGLSRTVHFRTAALITTFIPTVGGLGVAAAESGDPGWFAFMALNPALGTLLLPIRGAAIAATVNLGAVGLVLALASGIDGDMVIVAMVFNTIVAGVLLTATRHRNQLEDDRRAELLARQRLNEAVLAASFGGIVLHDGGAIVEANEAFAELFGLDPVAVRGETVEALFEPEARVQLDALLAGVGGEVAELTARRRDGTTFAAEVVAPQIDAGPADTQVLAVQDVTERRRATEAMARAQRMESVGRLAAGIAHDTNNQLAVIATNAEMLLRERAESARVSQSAQLIKDAAEQIATLVRRVLLMGRTRSGGTTEVAVGPFLSRLAPMWRNLLGSRIELELEVAPGLGAVRVRELDLEQVFLNLVLNARAAMGLGGVLRIETRGVADEVRIVVSDTGEGILPEHLDQVFTAFFTTKDEVGGTGLGLYTSRKVVEEAGGTITVASDPSGTTFDLRLPAIPVGADAVPSLAERSGP